MLDAMKQHGVFSWNELMTTDIDGAKNFYNKVFNWKLEDMEMDQPYTMAKVSGQEVAGLMPMPPNAPKMPAMWGAYITVDNVDDTVKQVQQLGGQVLLEAKDIPTVGRICVLADPQGAAFSIISYLDKS